MGASLSPELRALCEWASHQQDPQQLLALAKRINEVLEEQEPKTPGKATRQPANAAKRVTFTNCVTDLLAQPDPALRDD